MDNSNKSGSGLKWTVGILVVIFAALFTLAIVFDWFGWRDGEPKERIEPITPEMVADGEVAPNASLEQLPEGELVEKIPSVTEENGDVIIPGNPKVKEVLSGNAVLIDEDGVKSVKFVAPMAIESPQGEIKFEKGDKIVNLVLKHDVIESGTLKTVGGKECQISGLSLKL